MGWGAGDRGQGQEVGVGGREQRETGGLQILFVFVPEETLDVSRSVWPVDACIRMGLQGGHRRIELHTQRSKPRPAAAKCSSWCD